MSKTEIKVGKWYEFAETTAVVLEILPNDMVRIEFGPTGATSLSTVPAEKLRGKEISLEKAEKILRQERADDVSTPKSASHKVKPSQSTKQPTRKRKRRNAWRRSKKKRRRK